MSRPTEGFPKVLSKWRGSSRESNVIVSDQNSKKSPKNIPPAAGREAEACPKKVQH